MDKIIIIKDLKNYYSEETFKTLTGFTYDNIPEKNLNDFFQKHCAKNSQVVNISELSEKYNNKAFLVNTPDGFQDIGNLYVKGPYFIYSIKTKDFEIKCSENHLIETIEGWKPANLLKKNDSILTKIGYQNISYIRKSKNKEITYDFEVMHENHRYWGGTGISSHNTGKTFIALSVCREAQKKGWTPIYLDSENSIDPGFVKRLGCDPSKFIIKQVSTVKEVTTFIINLCKSFEDKGIEFPKVLLVLDSIGNLTSDKELSDSIEGKSARDMTRAQEVKSMFRVISTPLGKLSIPIIVNNHVYASISSFFGGVEQASGSGIKFSSSITMMLTAAKLEDKTNDKTASEKKGEFTKNGVLVTAKPIKSRFCIPQKVKFQIPFFCKPNPYVGLEQYMTWDNSKVVRGDMLNEKEYLKLSPGEQLKCIKFEDNDFSCWVLPKDTSRKMFVGHLHDTVPILEFFTDKVFTQEFLEYLDENVIKPAFQLPDQSSFEDIKELEDTMGIQTGDSENYTEE